jgi:Kef-type K+ transport system membrane component KefB
MPVPTVTSQIVFLGVIFILLVVPRALQRFRLPAPLTCFGLGMGTALLVADYSTDPTLSLLSVLGISSLFLFAGLEVDIFELKKHAWALFKHLFIRCVVLAASAWIGIEYFHFTWQVAGLIALAIFTPSTGFILESLANIDITENEEFWVKTKAIVGELLALLLLFVVLKSDSYQALLNASGVLLLIAFGLPLLLIVLGRLIIPYAPGSEFSLLVMVGLVAAYLTKQIGVYYLVGAFLTGLAARLLHVKMPTLASDKNLHAIELFASFFVPFYFFYRGMKVPEGAIQLQALWIGLSITAAVLPLRIGLIVFQRRFLHGDDIKSSFYVAIALAPTLIFTLVIASILHERYGISDALFGGLLIYVALSTILPSFVLSRPVVLDVEDEPLHTSTNPTEPSTDPSTS